MADFVQFTDSSGKKVYINPYHVLQFRGMPGGGTQIRVGPGEVWVSVKEPPDTVAKILSHSEDGD